MNAAKKKKPGRWGQFVLFVCFLAIGAVCGVWIARFLEETQLSGRPAPERVLLFAALILLLYVAMLVQIILHEAGHLAAGLLSGYRFGSFRVGGWMWIKVEGKIRFKRLSLLGTGGQCLMVPPEMKADRFPYILYNLGGSLMNLLTAALFLLLHGLLQRVPVVSLFCAMLAVTGVGFALINGIPLRLGTINNDGSNARELGKDPDALRSFWLQLQITEQAARGDRLREMPEAWFALPAWEKMDNSMVAALAVFRVNWLMDCHRFVEAKGLVDQVLDRSCGLIGLHRGLLQCEQLFLALMTGEDQARIDAICSRGLRKFMRQMRRYPSVLRTGYAYTSLRLQDKKLADRLLEQFQRCAGTYPYQGDMEGERELIELVKARAEAPAPRREAL